MDFNLKSLGKKRGVHPVQQLEEPPKFGSKTQTLSFPLFLKVPFAPRGGEGNSIFSFLFSFSLSAWGYNTPLSKTNTLTSWEDFSRYFFRKKLEAKLVPTTIKSYFFIAIFCQPKYNEDFYFSILFALKGFRVRSQRRKI